jgi:hypothetical protein
MGEASLRFGRHIRWALQALLFSAVLLAPVWGQVHKTVHGLKSSAVTEQVLFSDHAEGSVVCLALDHLGTGDALIAFTPTVDAESLPSLVGWPLVHSPVLQQAFSFEARGPPAFP